VVEIDPLFLAADLVVWMEILQPFQSSSLPRIFHPSRATKCKVIPSQLKNNSTHILEHLKTLQQQQEGIIK
jgi:hypothetical protein